MSEKRLEQSAPFSIEGVSEEIRQLALKAIETGDQSVLAEVPNDEIKRLADWLQAINEGDEHEESQEGLTLSASLLRQFHDKVGEEEKVEDWFTAEELRAANNLLEPVIWKVEGNELFVSDGVKNMPRNTDGKDYKERRVAVYDEDGCVLFPEDLYREFNRNGQYETSTRTWLESGKSPSGARVGGECFGGCGVYGINSFCRYEHFVARRLLRVSKS